MDGLTPPRVKICCIASVEEAWLAIRHGASALGFVSAMPSGPGPIDEELIAEIVRHVPPGVATVLLTCATESDAIVAQQRRTGANTLQLVDAVRPSVYADLGAVLPGVELVQVIHVTGETSLEEARSVTGMVDALLLDSGNPALPIKELGGTGRVHDWDISRRVRDSVEVPVFLAGGLTASNIAEAVRRVEPFGIDVCSGVRTNGRLDEFKLRAFFAAISVQDPA